MGREGMQMMLCKTRARRQRMATEARMQVRKMTASFKTEVNRSVDEWQDVKKKVNHCFHHP